MTPPQSRDNGFIFLPPWAEITGRVEKIEVDGHLIVELSTGMVSFDLPPDRSEQFQSVLQEKIGSNIAILRTEDGYRVKDEDGDHVAEVPL